MGLDAVMAWGGTLVTLADPAVDPAGQWTRRRYRISTAIGIRAACGVIPLNKGRKVALVLVERCWVCLEQPAVTTVRAADGREYPVCDVCSVEHPHGPDAAHGHITDD